MEKNQRYENFYLYFIEYLNNQLFTYKNLFIILKLFIYMNARGNKLSSCQIPDQYLKKQQTFRTLVTLAEKKKRKEKSEYNRVVITTLKTESSISPSP